MAYWTAGWLVLEGRAQEAKVVGVALRCRVVHHQAGGAAQGLSGWAVLGCVVVRQVKHALVLSADGFAINENDFEVEELQLQSHFH